ncbi:hypothetical protein FQZ97_820330 [compost metagenome]
MHHLDPSLLRKQFGAQVGRGGIAGRAIVHRTRIFLRQSHQLLQGIDRHLGAHCDDLRNTGYQRHVVDFIHHVGHFLQVRQHGDATRHAEAEGVAVWFRLDGGVHTDHTTGPCLVVHHDALPQHLTETGSNGARKLVHRASGWIGHDEFDRVGWPAGLSLHRCHEASQDGRAEGEKESFVHVMSPWMVEQGEG